MPEALVTTWASRPIRPLMDSLRAARPAAGRPWLIAVDGRSGSGKTTVSSQVAAATGADVVHTDDVAWRQAVLDWDYLLVDGILRPLHGGLDADYRPPAWDLHRRTGSLRVSAQASTVIIEGVGAARRSLAPWFDVLIWVQADRSTAKKRAIERDGGTAEAESSWHVWDAEEVPFYEQDQPWGRADLVVTGVPESQVADGEFLVALS